MNCAKSRRLLALFVEDDLPEAESRPLERHLAGCGDCRRFASELRESQLYLKSLRPEAPPQAALLGVRARVLDRLNETALRPGWTLRLERAMFTGWRHKYALAGLTVTLAVGAVALATAWNAGESPDAGTPPALAEAAPPPPAPAPVEPVAEAPDSRAPEAAAVAAPSPSARPPEAAPAEAVFVEAFDLFAPLEIEMFDPGPIETPETGPAPVVIKLVTDDPNVVIYWLAESGGEDAAGEGGI